MPPRDANIQHQIDEINSLGQGLSKWEESFMEDLTDQWERSRKLSASQSEKLGQIYSERVR